MDGDHSDENEDYSRGCSCGIEEKRPEARVSIDSTIVWGCVMNPVYGNYKAPEIYTGISLKNLYMIRQRGYVSGDLGSGRVKKYDKARVDFTICQLERNKMVKREIMRRKK